MKKGDSFIGIFGLVLTIAVFFAQGPYKHAWSYVTVFACPILLTAALIALNRSNLNLKQQRRVITRLIKNYNLVMGVNISSELVVRILNTDGDVDCERRLRYEIVKNTNMHRTKSDLLYSDAPLDSEPPAAKILNCSNSNVRLTAVKVSSDEAVSIDSQHFSCCWYYKLTPPLSGKGQFIEYEYFSRAPASEKNAFTDSGGTFSFHHEVELMQTQCTLIAPPSHRINIIDFNVTMIDGTILEVPKAEQPLIEHNGHMLSWKPMHLGAKFACRYKLTPV